MFSAPIPHNEAERLATLHSYAILDTPPEQGYDDVTQLAAFICGTPISLVSLIDKDRQWFKSERGLGARETPRSQSFCANTLVDAQTLIVEDAQTDPRFKDNPLVLGDPKIRFYAGAPIVDTGGHVLGTVLRYRYRTSWTVTGPDRGTRSTRTSGHGVDRTAQVNLTP